MAQTVVPAEAGIETFRRPFGVTLGAEIDVPTLIMVGGEDALTPPSEARAMHEAIRGSRLPWRSSAQSFTRSSSARPPAPSARGCR